MTDDFTGYEGSRGTQWLIVPPSPPVYMAWINITVHTPPNQIPSRVPEFDAVYTCTAGPVVQCERSRLQLLRLQSRIGRTQEAKYVESWPNATSAWAGWSKFDTPVDRYGGVHSLLQCTGVS